MAEEEKKSAADKAIDALSANLDARNQADQQRAETAARDRKMQAAGAAANAGARVATAPVKVGVKVLGGIAQKTGRELTNEGFIFYLILAVMIHMAEWGLGFARPDSFFDLQNRMILLHLAMAVVTWSIFFLKPREFSQNPQGQFISLGILIGIAYFAYLFPMIGSMNPGLQNMVGLNILTHPLMHPIWIYAGFFIFTGNRLARLMFMGTVLFWTFYIIFSLFAGAGDFGYSTITQEHYATMGEMWETFFTGAKEFFSTVSSGMSKAISSWFGSSIVFAAGPYYSGHAEEAKPVGVVIEKMQDFPTQFPTTKNVVVNAWIKAMDGVEELIIVKDTSCWSERENTKATLSGESSPKTLAVFPSSRQPLRCDMEKNLGTGSYDLYFSATYELESKSTLDTFFADFGKKFEADTAEKDLLEGFPNKRAINTYTNGPVMVGVGISSGVPVSIVNLNSDFCTKNLEEHPGGPDFPTGKSMMDLCVAYNDLPITLGITLENRAAWSGEITSLNKISIDLPKGLELGLGEDNCDFIEPADNGGESDLTGAVDTNEGMNKYELALLPEYGGSITRDIEEGENQTHSLGGRDYSVVFTKVSGEEKYNMNLNAVREKRTLFIEEIKDMEVGRIYMLRGVEFEIEEVDEKMMITFRMSLPLDADRYSSFQCDLIQDHDVLLGGSPVAPKSIIVDVDYNFVTKQAIKIKVTQ